MMSLLHCVGVTMPLSGMLSSEIADQAEVSIQIVRVDFDTLFAGRELSDTTPKSPNDDEGEERRASSSSEINKTDAIDTTTRVDLSHTEELSAPSIENEIRNESLSISGETASSTCIGKKEPDDEPTLTTSRSDLVDLTDLKSLRGRAWTLAARLAQRKGIGDLVAPLSGKGLGFILRDVPDPALADQLDEDTLSQVSMVWWQLAASAEMTVAPVESIVSNLPADSVLRQALEQQDAGLLFNSVWTLDPGHTGYRLWRRLGKSDWGDLLNLMDTYRQIHHLAEETAIRLWE